MVSSGRPHKIYIAQMLGPNQTVIFIVYTGLMRFVFTDSFLDLLRLNRSWKLGFRRGYLVSLVPNLSFEYNLSI